MVWITVLFLIIFDFRILTFPQILSKTYRWQTLVGSFLGIVAPVGLYLLKQEYEKGIERKNFLLFLEKNIVQAIHNLADIDGMLHMFVETSLARYITNVGIDDANGQYSVGQVFVPLTPTFVIDKELLRDSTNSQYLESAIMSAIDLSQNIPVQMADINRQFDRTITLNTQLGLTKLNNPAKHNSVLLMNLAEFQEFLKGQVFDNNFPIYLRSLVKALIVLNHMQKVGLKGWTKQFSFSPSVSTDEKFKIMDDFFEAEINKKIDSLRGSFKSDLVLFREKTAWEIVMGL